MLQKAHPIRRIKLVKMIHNWQNTGLQKGRIRDSKMDNNMTNNWELTSDEATCHMCPAGCGEVEGNLHYLYCGEVTAVEGRKPLIKRVLKRLGLLHTCKSIKSLVGRVLCVISNNKKVDSDLEVENLKNTSNLRGVIVGQTEIGWHDLCQGFFHKEWTGLQQEYYRRMGKKSKYLNIRRWTRMFSTILCDYSLECWDLRNKTLHGESVTEARAIQLKKLRKRVGLLYKQKGQLRGHKNSSIFDLPMEKRQNMGVQATVLWIGMAEEVLRLHRENATKSTLHQWLQSRSGTPHNP
jgi:hypothetical protein